MKLAKTYEPKEYESTIYALWESASAFAPSSDKTKPTYSIVMPPPNANGNLHLGHALMGALEDILIRYHRMKGERALYIPGADHAGFETWVVYERQLEKEGKSRFDFTRDELYSQVWDFVARQRGNMEIQLREMGVSCDWDKLVFTLDENVIETAYQTFKKLWDDKLIYRGKRLVNYCTKHHTGFSDIEVEYEDRNTPLYYLKYGPFTLATTRPETTFGDTAVAVHPDDDRYKQYVDKTITVEGVNGPFDVVVVADEYVDPQFGTGVVKITPAHDFNDWEVGQRHDLPVVQVIDFDGKMNEKASRFAGMTVLEARAAVVEALREKGLLVKVDEHYKNRVAVCYKCKTVIEPMLMDQWFVKMKPLADKALTALKADKIHFYPESKGRIVAAYLENIRDWNLSRQIPWGIPIPAFQNVDDPDDWIFNTAVDQETITVSGKQYKRDADTFDTWFSSGQWPFIVTQHHKDGNLAEFYPTDVMETGHDLLDRWVARMIMLGLYVTDDIPFKNVYLHGMVLDPHGQKMSKSKGNVINPQEIMEQYGSDALRMGIVANRSGGVNQAYSPAATIAGRNFCNKLWNIARYIEDVVGKEYRSRTLAPKTMVDHWMAKRLKEQSQLIEDLLNQYRFAEAYETMYHLIWDDVADWYIEASKVELNKPLLAFVLETILKLAHPFAPFVTETIWQTLEWEKQLLITSVWPETFPAYDAQKAEQFVQLQQLIGEVRYLTKELGLRDAELQHHQDQTLEAGRDLLAKLARVKAVEMVDAHGLHIAHPTLATWLVVDDKTLQAHKNRLADRLSETEQHIKQLDSRLANKSYVKNAPAAVVEQTRSQRQEQQALYERLQGEMHVFDNK
jgi:valyl-tRNA synthetase